MEGAPLELRPGCVHMAWDKAFTGLAHVWPSTTPDHWWVDAYHKPVGGLVPTTEVEAALALADFQAESWSVWRVDPKPNTLAGPRSSGTLGRSGRLGPRSP